MTFLKFGAVAAVSLAASVVGAGAASAACSRHVYNRSPYALVVSQNGGPGAIVPAGRSLPIRLDGPGRLDLTAFCATPLSPASTQASQGAPVAQASFSYVSDPGICFMRFGIDQLVPYANRIDLANGTMPFVVNNPHQGDVVLGPFGPACPPAF